MGPSQRIFFVNAFPVVDIHHNNRVGGMIGFMESPQIRTTYNSNIRERLRQAEAERAEQHAMDDPQGRGFGEFCNNCVIRNTVLDTLESGTHHMQVEATFDFSLEDKTRSLTLLVSTTPTIFRDENMALMTIMDITGH